MFSGGEGGQRAAAVPPPVNKWGLSPLGSSPEIGSFGCFFFLQTQIRSAHAPKQLWSAASSPPDQGQRSKTLRAPRNKSAKWAFAHVPQVICSLARDTSSC